MSDSTADTAVAVVAVAATEAATGPGPVSPSISRLSTAAGADYSDLQLVDPAHYVLVRELARGGMGRIQVARDRRLGRDVAIKEVLIDDEAARGRFEREARITARLQHPSIVSVHEAGRWPTGEPFYAMRLVIGRSLDAVITDAKTFEQRMALVPNVLAIANAMAYAHGQRVIHRDIKPHNVIVAEFGETVLLDWGLAKALGEVDISLPPARRTRAPATTASQPGETTVGDVIGTPAYMPPEQANGGTVDERADVYALGAVLYHVLAGRAPYSGTTSTEILTRVISEPPAELATLAPRAPEELVAIVERAMTRDPSGRYPTARELAEDLQRFQTGQLVGAHRYSLGQLFGRWMRRHRTVLIASAAAAVAAIVIGVLALQRIVAAHRVVAEERAVAMANAEGAEGLLDFMLTELSEKLRDVGHLDLLDAVARRAAAYYDARSSVHSPHELENIARSRAVIGSVFYKRGNLAAAEAELVKAQAAYREVLARAPAGTSVLPHIAYAENILASIAAARGQSDAARAGYEQALSHATLGHDRDGDDPESVAQIIAARKGLSAVASTHGDTAQALDELRGTLAVAKLRLKGDEPGAAERREEDVLDHIGHLELSSHDVDGALRDFREVLRIAASLPGANDNPNLRYDIASAHESLGHALIAAGQTDAAESELALGTEMADHLVELDPSHVDWADLRSSLYEQVGVVRYEKHDLAGASVAFNTSYKITAEIAARDPANLGAARSVSVLANKLGDIAVEMKDIPGALVSFKAALATREKLVAADPSNADWEHDLFWSHIKLGNAYNEANSDADLRTEFEAAHTLAVAALKKWPANITAATDLVLVDSNLGWLLVKNFHQQDVGRAMLQEALATATQFANVPHVPSTIKDALARLPAAIEKLK